MPFRFLHTIVCVLVLLAPTGHAQESALGANVEGVIAFAREHNPDIASARYEAEAAQARIVSADALPDPKFRTEWRDITRMGDQNPTLSPSRVGSMRYQLMQDLPWWGKRDLKRESAEALAEVAQWRVADTWREQESRIKSTYVQLYYLQDIETLTTEIRDVIIRLEQTAQARYSSGIAAQQDVIRAQLEKTALQEELITLENEKRQWQSVLNSLMGRPAEAVLASPSYIWPLPAPEVTRYEVLTERARANSPQLRAENAQIIAAERFKSLSYKNRFPDFSVGISPIQYNGSIREWELMVEVTIPLQQGALRAKERESDALLAAAHARKNAAANQIHADLKKNISILESTRRSLALINDSLLPKATLTLRSALAAYENGKVDFSTVLDAQKQLRQIRLSQIKNEMNARLRLADIERVIGEDL